MPCYAALPVSFTFEFPKWNNPDRTHSAQGAAQALEDADVLGVLFHHIETPDQIPDLLRIYECVRKTRTTEIAKKTRCHRTTLHMADSPDQIQRDIELLEYQDNPFEGFQNPWRDPIFQRWLFGWDSKVEAEDAWSRYKADSTWEGVGHRVLG